MFCNVPYVLSCGTSSEHKILFYSEYCSNFRPTSRFLVIFAFTVRIDAFFSSTASRFHSAVCVR